MRAHPRAWTSTLAPLLNAIDRVDPIPDEGYYETQDGLSWAVNPAYAHEWNQGGSEIRLQISRRETPTLPTERRTQIEQSYFQHLSFTPVEITCLALPEILAEKIRACYQRSRRAAPADSSS